MEASKNLSLDPTHFFPIEIIEEIFHHLKVKDLMKCTLVSTVWNEIIGSSLRIMEKVVLTTGNTCDNVSISSNEFFVVADIKDSTRKYQNIRIFIGNEFIDFLIEFMNKKRIWKHVKIDFTKFSSALSLSKLIEIIEPTVVYLELVCLRFHPRNCSLKSYEFKKLETLRIRNSYEYNTVSMFTKCSNLRNIEMKDSAYFESYPDFFSNQKHLTHLNCDAEWINAVFQKNLIRNFHFQLERLFIVKSIYTVDEHFQNFLKTQKKIKEISFGVDSWDNLKMLQIIYNMKSLEKLSFDNLPPEILTEQLMLSSNSIKTVDLNSYLSTLFQTLFDSDDVDTWKKQNNLMPHDIRTMFEHILITMPNLEQIKIICIDENLANFMIKHFKKLKKVASVHILNGNCCQNILSSANVSLSRC
jgi:F-box domain